MTSPDAKRPDLEEAAKVLKEANRYGHLDTDSAVIILRALRYAMNLESERDAALRRVEELERVTALPEPVGTCVCRICGDDTPHAHTFVPPMPRRYLFLRCPSNGPRSISWNVTGFSDQQLAEAKREMSIGTHADCAFDLVEVPAFDTPHPALAKGG